MNTLVLVIGSPNTDITTSYTRQTIIGPGGKARNIADMTSRLLVKGQVALVGHTSKDKLGLWKVPMVALKSSGVDVNFVSIDKTSKQLPGIALISLDESGESRTTFLPGAAKEFDRRHVDMAESLFKNIVMNKGYVVFTLECPFDTLNYAIQKASLLGLDTILDCGGLNSNLKPNVVCGLLNSGVFLVKPNAYEAKCVTGVTIKNFSSAQKAANILKLMGARNVLITAGKNGAYLFSDKQERHIMAPKFNNFEATPDSTGCGDQALAVICAGLANGMDLETAAETAIVAASLQFYRSGVSPLSWNEIINNRFVREKATLSFA